MSNFEEAIVGVMRNEGGFINNEHDVGGATNFGISLRFLRGLEEDRLRKYGIFGVVDVEVVRNLTQEQAENIYKGEFWDNSRLDEIKYQVLTNYIFDMIVNMGIGQGIKLVQRACWAATMNRGCIRDDGRMGEYTVSLVNTLGETLLPVLIAARVEFYRGLGNHQFLDGWINRAYSIG